MANFKLDSGTPLVIHLSGPGRYEISIRLSPPDAPLFPPPSDHGQPDLPASGPAISAPGPPDSDTPEAATSGTDNPCPVKSEPALLRPAMNSAALRGSSSLDGNISSLAPKPKDKKTKAKDTKNKVKVTKAKAKTKKGKTTGPLDDIMEEIYAKIHFFEGYKSAVQMQGIFIPRSITVPRAEDSSLADRWQTE